MTREKLRQIEVELRVFLPFLKDFDVTRDAPREGLLGAQLIGGMSALY